MAVKRVDHIGVVVKDLEKSIAFYQDVLDLKLKERMTHTNGVIELAFLGYEESDETEIELIQGYSDTLPSEATIHHFAITVDDIEEEYARIKSLDNTELIDEEIVTLPNGYRYFYVYGPEKEWIEFFQR
ncbi:MULTISPECIES: VOC family protein [Peribacillus]|uniref:VOC family protein n=1 Tax=Peribacillus castrilensis TaxID=2897690 RepID=A0AAW9NA30_9BACI|nr:MULTISPECIES: VOC family protein [Peribacillus]MEC0272064.1 VOC family protein [Peribacillus castrilensis]MCR8868949.1 VOC family protein [Peribacillus frigoritolerans]MCY9005566.1 VOC family protein [Peribacillus frigoritolerans]MCY9138119.1 VOC family protein [Peribacillus frigoritolerans]MCZ0871102.1 VOC family protein [Peribacillus sp. AS_2]